MELISTMPVNEQEVFDKLLNKSDKHNELQDK